MGRGLAHRAKQREETRRRLRVAAVDVIRRDGLAAARVEDIAAAVGVSRGSFYFHFPTKEDVLLELQDESEVRVAAAIDALPAGAPLPEVLGAACTAIAAEWEQEPKLFMDIGAVALRRATLTIQDEGRVDPVRRAMSARFAAAAGRGELGAVLPPEVLADMFLMNVFAATMGWCGRQDLPLAGVLAAVSHLFVRGAGGW